MDSLNGILFKDWFQLLRENKFSISGSQFFRVLGLTILSINNSKDSKKEYSEFYEDIKRTKLVRDPIFVLGHWRSGTTFLHNILSQDPQFGYANIFEIRNPHTFLTRQNIFNLRKQTHSAESRPTDNVQIDFTSPAEEEFGVAILSKMSPLFGWVFPRNAKKYDIYTSFLNTSNEDQEYWKNCFHFFLQKLTFLYKKQLLLKSPLNTARIRLILDCYPNAKFINIHRNPFHVFQSTKRMYETAVASSRIGKYQLENLDETIINNYKDIYEVFFEQKVLIPKDNLVEVSFEDLEQETLKIVDSIYNSLKIDQSAEAARKIGNYVVSLQGYKKNIYKDLDHDLKSRIVKEWGASFSAWNYSV